MCHTESLHGRTKATQSGPAAATPTQWLHMSWDMNTAQEPQRLCFQFTVPPLVITSNSGVTVLSARFHVSRCPFQAVAPVTCQHVRRRLMVEIQAEVPLSQPPEPPHHRSDCLAGWAPPPPTGLSREPPWGRVEKKAEVQRGPQDFTPGEEGRGTPKGDHLPNLQSSSRSGNGGGRWGVLWAELAPCVAAAGPSPGAAGRRSRCTR